jgi:phosphate-selective porin OprO and OprP
MAKNNNELLQLMIDKGIILKEEGDSLKSIFASSLKEPSKMADTLTPHSKNLYHINAFTQIRFQSLQESGKNDYAEVRRARFIVSGNVTSAWEYRLHVEFVSSPKILDAFAVYKPFPFLKLQAGQFKIPFSLENLASSKNMETINRSNVVEALVARGHDVVGNQNGRDIGIQASGSFWKNNDAYIVDYFIAGLNGNGINTADNNEAKDLAARLVFHPVKKLEFGASYYNGYDKYGTPESKNHIRTRIGYELSYIYKFASIATEYISGEDGGIKKYGYYVQMSAYLYKNKLQLVGRYDFLDADSNKKNNSTTDYLGGINFNFNENVKLQADITHKEEETFSINNDIINIQLQFGF